MIPYFQLTQFHLGPLTIYVWGLMAALGILAGVWVMKHAAKKLNLNPAPFEEAAFWILLAAFAGARVGHFLFYATPSEFLNFFKIWEGGWSSLGGILGALIAGISILKLDSRFRGNGTGHGSWRAADILLAGFPIGMAIGRLGCFLIHDHPGTLTDFVLGVNFPDGARHDLGLYESLLMFALAGILAWQAPKLIKREGDLALITLGSYALIRFPLDFLRIGDTLYLGLTAAQYACIGILVGVLMLSRARNLAHKL